MPPPSYIDITSLPFNRTVTISEFNSGTFGGVANEVWFRRVVSDPFEALGNFVEAGGTFLPFIFLYESDGTTLIKQITPAGVQFAWYHVLAAGTYFIKIRNNPAGPTDIDFSTEWNSSPILASSDIVVGSIIVNDDTDGYAATVIAPDGTFQGIFNDGPPAGEIVAILPTGESLWHDPFGMRDALLPLALFDADLNYVMSVDTINGLGSSVPLISHDDTQFWVYDSGDRVLYSVTTAGVVTAETSALPTGNKFALGVSRDGSLAYYSKGRFDGKIYRYDISADIPLTDLYDIPGFVPSDDTLAMTPNNNPGEILILDDGSIITYWHDLSAATTHILQLQPDGTLTNDFSYLDASARLIDHISYGKTDVTGFITIWFQNTGLYLGDFGQIDLSDGSFISELPTDLFSNAVNLVGDSDTKFGPSESCGMIRYRTASVTTASITVTKVTDPVASPQEFDFITAGLDPSTFTLTDGQSQVFLDLEPGTYGVTETVPDGWTAVYDVSNGDPNTAIVVEEGDNITVTVTNTQGANTGSGIYKIVQDKRNDTLWVNVDTLETVDIKIPDPSHRSGLIGD